MKLDEKVALLPKSFKRLIPDEDNTNYTQNQRNVIKNCTVSRAYRASGDYRKLIDDRQRFSSVIKRFLDGVPYGDIDVPPNYRD